MINYMRQPQHMQDGLIYLSKNFLNRKTSVGLEIGSYAGESTRIFLDNFNGTIHCVDPWNPTYYSGDQLIHAEREFDELLSGGRIVKHKMTSNEAFKHFEDLDIKFDWIYIDGNHRYEFVKSDIESALKLLKPKGILCGHDYGYIKAPGVKQAVHELLNYPDAVYCDTSWIKFI